MVIPNIRNINKYYSGKHVGSIYLTLQIPALISSLWSFKMYKNLFNATPSTKKGTTVFKNNDFLKHEKGGGILGSGVCRLGKLAGWLIIIQTIISCIILYTVNINDINYKKTVFGIAITNTILLAMLIIPASIMNPPLSIRSIPFYSIQIMCIVYLFYIWNKFRKFEKIVIR